MKILRVTFHREVDSDPDLSYLGEYGHKPKDGAIDRKANGDMERHEFRYFYPAMSGEESGNPDSPEQDYRRHEAYNRGDWAMLYVYASAKVQLTTNGPIQRISSRSIGGMDSDSGPADFEEAKDDQLQELAEELEALGFTPEEIAMAFEDVEEKE